MSRQTIAECEERIALVSGERNKAWQEANKSKEEIAKLQSEVDGLKRQIDSWRGRELRTLGRVDALEHMIDRLMGVRQITNITNTEKKP